MSTPTVEGGGYDGFEHEVIFFETFYEAAQYAIRSDEQPAMVFDHPGEEYPYVVAVSEEVRELEGDGHVPYDAIQTVIAASMPAIPDYPPTT